MCKLNIVRRVIFGKLQIFACRKILIRNEMAFHNGSLKEMHESDELNDTFVGNADEGHLVLIIDEGHMHGFWVDEDTRFVDFVSGGDSITLTVRITGGKQALIHILMSIFKTCNHSHMIRGGSDTIWGVWYRSSPKVGMDGRTWRKWIDKPCVLKNDTYGDTRIVYVNNYPPRIENFEVRVALRRTSTKLDWSSGNIPERSKVADSLNIQKSSWWRNWDMHRLDFLIGDFSLTD